MSYCLSSQCRQPQNLETALFCWSCGAKLLLRERYRPLKPLGQGGFGRTFLAIDEDLPSRPFCVIKQFCPQVTGEEGVRKATELFTQEAVYLDQIGKHPQIPDLFAYFKQESSLYLVEEFIPGPTLEQELVEKGTLSELQIQALLEGLLPVLGFIHQHQIVHRDIKPANIIRKARESAAHEVASQLFLIDFGISKLMVNPALLFQTGTIIGSPEYMAPEQTRGKVLPASDLFSLGVTCVHLLTGISPFDLFDINQNRWVWRSYLPSKSRVSDRLGQILDKLLAGAVQQRYQSVAEVLQDLHRPVQTHVSQPLHQGHNRWSEVGVDYTKLRQHLAARHWEQADQETWNVLCQALGKPPRTFLDNGDLEKLPCADLRTIDQFWLQYSRGRFGFSVQTQIYHQVGADYGRFCDRVGWPAHNSSSIYSHLNFTLKAAIGHLPSRVWVGGYYWWRHPAVIAARLTTCDQLAAQR